MNEYYMRFPAVLKEALENNRVNFSQELIKEYQSINVYRGIRFIPKDKEKVTKEDFLSQAERGFPGINYSDIHNYSCSCFKDKEELLAAFKLPRKNKGIAVGLIKKEYGPIELDSESSHIHWFLLDNVDPSIEFEVMKNE